MNHLDDHLAVPSQHSFSGGQVWHCLLPLLCTTEEHKQLSEYKPSFWAVYLLLFACFFPIDGWHVV